MATGEQRKNKENEVEQWDPYNIEFFNTFFVQPPKEFILFTFV